MRIDAETLNDIIPRFLKDGWQVVRLFHCQTPSNNLTSLFARVERACHR